MTIHDPYDGKQIKFERTDRSGRWSPIFDEDDKFELGIIQYFGGAVIAIALAVALVFNI